MRVIMWTALWLLSLCSLTIQVAYKDGLTINLNGWA